MKLVVAETRGTIWQIILLLFLRSANLTFSHQFIAYFKLFLRIFYNYLSLITACNSLPIPQVRRHTSGIELNLNWL